MAYKSVAESSELRESLMRPVFINFHRVRDVTPKPNEAENG